MLSMCYCNHVKMWIVTILHLILFELTDRARDTQTGEIVALKKMRMENEKDGKCVNIVSNNEGLASLIQ